MADVEKDVIAARAFALYVRRGRQSGHAIDDWLEAERQLRAEKAGTAASSAGPMVSTLTAPKALQTSGPGSGALVSTPAPSPLPTAPMSRPIPPPRAPLAPATAPPEAAAPKAAPAKQASAKGKKRR